MGENLKSLSSPQRVTFLEMTSLLSTLKVLETYILRSDKIKAKQRQKYRN